MNENISERTQGWNGVRGVITGYRLESPTLILTLTKEMRAVLFANDSKATGINSKQKDLTSREEFKVKRDFSVLKQLPFKTTS